MDNQQSWTTDEIRDLLLYVREMDEINKNLKAGIILMQAKLDNEEAKVKRLTLYINQITNVN
jgi:hypothetical protein